MTNDEISITINSLAVVIGQERWEDLLYLLPDEFYGLQDAQRMTVARLLLDAAKNEAGVTVARLVEIGEWAIGCITSGVDPLDWEYNQNGRSMMEGKMKGKPNTDVEKAFQLMRDAKREPLDRDQLIAILEAVYFLTPEKMTRAEFTEAAKEAANNY